ncbi:MAG: cobyric acid synthase [Thiohalomonadales bacterium]
MVAKAIMVQGTTSDAGKSAIVTGLCRLLRRQGYSVAPFKPQNMALNSAVTVDGGEIGRAQAVQAQACGLEPHSDMNPILLKPSGDKTSQVIVCGQVRHEMTALAYHHYKAELFPSVLEAFHRLASRVDIVVIEGAGSPAEINLRDNDIANMGFALALQIPVILVADIERGGVFAHIVGTMEVLDARERALIKGFIINRFRGDIDILKPGLDWLERRTQRPVLATLPYLHDFYLEAEDSLASQCNRLEANSKIRIVVPRLPRLSNQTDFDPLLLHPEIDLQFISEGVGIPAADLLILPGSKNVRADIAWLRENNWTTYINKHLRYGGKVIGICGGYQMLGKSIDDPQGIEGEPGCSQGFDLLDVDTCLAKKKQLTYIEGNLFLTNAPVRAYEIHAGITTGHQTTYPAVTMQSRIDGAVSADDQIFGTYLHGLFDRQEACAAILKWAGFDATILIDIEQQQQRGIDLMADTLDRHLSVAEILTILKIV